MEIGKEWQITADSLNVTVQKRRLVPAKPGKPAHYRWANEGYFSNMTNAINFVMEEKIMAGDLKDLKAILKSIAEVKELIKGLAGSKEDKEIAENMKDVWANQQAGSA